MDSNVVNSAEENPIREKVQHFFSQWSFVFASAFGIIAILFLLGPVVTYKTEVGDTETKYAVTLIDYFRNGFTFDWTMWVTLGLLFVGIVLPIIAGFLVRGEKGKENLMIGSALSFLVAFCFLFLSREFFANNSAEIENYHSVDISWGCAFSILFTVLAAGASTITPYQRRPISVGEIAENGILIAMAFGLNFIKLPIQVQGSVNFQMLPLMIIALRRGPASGLICGGILFGLLTCLTDGYGFVTYPFDYLIGFGSVAVMGFFRPLIFGQNQKGYNFKGEVFLLLAGVLSTFVRFVGGTVSSILIYNTTFVAALIYNVGYISLSGILALAVLMAIYGPLVKVNASFPARKSL
ncbi:MAG: energy-coupled thiamine transporter ThiT [Candidatus Enteromonas sp.]|nr:energy-coupled thiamine transporter ThiT [Candidatus Enteromonas sp.]